MKIAFVSTLPLWAKRQIFKEYFKHFEEVQFPDTADIVVCDINQFDFSHYPNVKYIVCPATNVDHLKNINENQTVISLLNDSTFTRNISSTAEYTMCLILMLMRKTYIKVDSWYRYNYLGSVIKGKKLGIIGYGRVGQQLHKIAEGFGMKVYAYDLLNNNALNEVLTNSDIISLHTSMNLGLPPVLGEEEIIAIKPGSYLVNTSRGYAIDEAALIKHSSKFNGIALDVLCGEPNPPNFETFKAMGNVYVTPHIAGCTSEDMITTSNHCLDKLLKLLKERGLK